LNNKLSLNIKQGMNMKIKITVYGLLWLMVSCSLYAQQVPCNDFEGIIEPSDTVEISSHVQGVISHVFFDRGDMVKKGAVIARLQSGIEKAAVEIAETRVEFEKRKDSRSHELFKKKLISTHEKDQLETDILLAQLQLNEAREHLKLRTLISPISGVVVEKRLSAGEFIGEGAVLVIAKINPLYVEIVVPVECYGKIQINDIGYALIQDPIKKNLQCRVIVIDRVIDAASGTFNIRLELANPKGELPAGLKCKVHF